MNAPVTDDMVARAVKALDAWPVWAIKNRRMHEYDEAFVRSLLEASLRPDT